MFEAADYECAGESCQFGGTVMGRCNHCSWCAGNGFNRQKVPTAGRTWTEVKTPCTHCKGTGKAEQ